MGFTKLDEGIVQSSIMNEDGDTFKVWITLLAICKEDGIAHCSSIFLSSVCHLSQDLVDSIIQKLSGPDSESRSTKREGRRIRRVNGGYELINYFKYRESGLRRAEAERKRLYRQELRKKKRPGVSGQCPDSSASASSSASFSAFNLEEIEKVWNDFAHKHDIPWINGITKGSARERALLARLHAPDWDLNKLLEAIAAQPFLMGDNPRGWLISFDWVLKPANLQKVMEGVYTKKIKGDRVGENK
jgi:hypothetical protein